MNVVIGDFNSHGVEWGYRSTDENDRLVEQWSDTNQLSLVHDAKQPKSFNSKRWQQGYNPDLAFVSYSIAHLAEKDVMDVIPKTRHRPISIKLNAAIRPRNVTFRRRPVQPTTPACTWWNRPEEDNSSGKLESTHPFRTSVKSDQVFFGVESVMRVNADSLLIRAAATSTSGTLNDLTTDLIMANNNNLKKAKWQSYAKEVENGIANTNPEKFVNLVRRSSNKNIPRGCRTSYVCGLNDQSKDMYEDYQRRFAEDPFNEDTVRVGDALLDEISEAQRSKWKEMIESTDFTHSSRKAWKTINKLTKDYTEPPQQCKVTADQVAHQLLLKRD